MRLLIALLILRAIASPLAVSRDSTPGHARFVVRVCVWPTAESQAGRLAVAARRGADRSSPRPAGFEAPLSGRLVPSHPPGAAADGRRFASRLPLRC